MGTPWTNEQLEEIYQKAHQTNVMSQLDDLEMSIKAAKLLNQHYIVVNNRYDSEVIEKLEEREYVVNHNNDKYPMVYMINWK